MDVEFDPEKDAANTAKHGVSLRVALDILLRPRLLKQDHRRDYGEARFNVFGMVAGRPMVCTFAQRGNVKRVISVRMASRKERRTWFS